MSLAFEHGARLVRIARSALAAHVRGEEPRPENSGGGGTEAHGVFCTLSSFPSGELRGCMGRLGPDLVLEEAVVRAAVHAAEDPRFPPLRPEELLATTVEISVLSASERVTVRKSDKFPSGITPGLDGLTLRYGPYFGLLLPQVWDSFSDPAEFLPVLCYKAGLTKPDAWRDSDAVLHRFRVQVFCEKTPAGEVHEDAGPWLPSQHLPRSA